MASVWTWNCACRERRDRRKRVGHAYPRRLWSRSRRAPRGRRVWRMRRRGPAPRPSARPDGRASCAAAPRRAARARDAEADGHDDLPRRDGHRRLRVARGQGRPEGHRLERRRERVHARRPRRAAGPPRDQGPRRGAHRRRLPRLRRARRPPRDAVHDEEPAAEAAGLPRHARRVGRPGHREGARRPERHRPERQDDDRLLRPVARRQARRRVAVAGRVRERRRPRLRRRDRTGERGGRHPARERRHGGREPRVGRRHRLLLHALPARGGAPRGRPVRLPAGLLPQARDRHGEGHLRGRQGLPAHRRGLPRRERRREDRRRPRGERRRRRLRALRARHPEAGGHLDAAVDLRRQDRGGKFGPDGTLYLHSHRKPHGEILRLSPATAPLAKATVLVPEGDAVIESFVPTATRLYVVDLVGGPSQVRIRPARRGTP